MSEYFNDRVVSALPHLGADFLAGGNLKATQQQILPSLLESRAEREERERGGGGRKEVGQSEAT